MMDDPELLSALIGGVYDDHLERTAASSSIGNVQPSEGQRSVMTLRLARVSALTFAFALFLAGQSSAEVPVTIDAPDETIVATFHAEGAQIYECKPDSAGKLMWQAREPVATLLLDGKTVGRHYAGLNWEHTDGSMVQAKVIASAPGSTATDIPWLKLEVTLRFGHGALSGVTTVQRINTRGGLAQGPCGTADHFLSVPYHADYVFLRPVE